MNVIKHKIWSEKNSDQKRKAIKNPTHQVQFPDNPFICWDRTAKAWVFAGQKTLGGSLKRFEKFDKMFYELPLTIQLGKLPVFCIILAFCVDRNL